MIDEELTEPFRATCERCTASVPVTFAEAGVRIGRDGSFVCDRCKPVPWAHPLDDPVISRRFGAAMMIARDLDTLERVLAGLPVMERRLQPGALRRASRAGAFPPPAAGSWITVTPEMLDAIAAGGRFRLKKKHG